VVNSLSLAKVSNCRGVRELLRKDQDQLLQSFLQDHTEDLFDLPEDQLQAEFHRISLYWLFFVSCGGKGAHRPCQLHPEFTPNDNANLIGSLVGITRSNFFGEFNSRAWVELQNGRNLSKYSIESDVKIKGILSLQNFVACRDAARILWAEMTSSESASR